MIVSFGFGFCGFSSLKILPGVREAGMGNVGVACATGPEGMVWNPAASSGIRSFAASASYTKWFLDTNQQSVFVVRNLGFMHLGFGVASFDAGKFDYRTEVPAEEPLGEFEPREFSFHLNFSRSFGDITDIGISGRYYYSKIMDRQAHAPGVDLGMRLLPMNRLILGASVVDFGKNLYYYEESFRLPTRGRLGAAYQYCLGNKVRLNLAGQSSFFFYTRTLNLRAGTEFTWARVASLRAGYEWLSDRSRLSLGLGFLLSQFHFDYSFTPMNDNLGAAHRISVGLCL
ncbi:hypothetical protein CH330_04515 [candidate division WOR-3 bacterium JGI_Cruoil_03_51_56]|uniref:PorV/PorQ family protein n=1 Tax=candidate division WOR-3 bacterium JGI_Cruoil_03_51_56 TaxID=1973747 RepID=A0A235BUF5_UNCW3|nr:MAG: hypothetical protein CH330_04515 [candidate division WOR-3 bacterium JGI_Cruoil_03_51_56]